MEESKILDDKKMTNDLAILETNDNILPQLLEETNDNNSDDSDNAPKLVTFVRMWIATDDIQKELKMKKKNQFNDKLNDYLETVKKETSKSMIEMMLDNELSSISTSDSELVLIKTVTKEEYNIKRIYNDNTYVE